MQTTLGDLLLANRNQELADRVESHHSRHLRELRSLRAAEVDEALNRRQWRALLRALRGR